MRTHSRLAAGLALATTITLEMAASACAPRATLPQPGRARAARTQVQITNHNWSDLKVYLVGGGAPLRLGTVTTTHTETFRLPAWVDVSITQPSFLVVPIGSMWSHLSEPVMVQAGQTIVWTVEQQPALFQPFVR
ncbi:MAG: hypothetical protein HY701_08900 [Gemmatimonadetes bacterium]|nr:hypothetical protein [Gemmatimonadota bacterium]